MCKPTAQLIVGHHQVMLPALCGRSSPRRQKGMASRLANQFCSGGWVSKGENEETVFSTNNQGEVGLAPFSTNWGLFYYP
jgi:hypothetical protein